MTTSRERLQKKLEAKRVENESKTAILSAVVEASEPAVTLFKGSESIKEVRSIIAFMIRDSMFHHAISECQSFLKKNKNNEDLLFLLADAYYKSGKISACRETHEKMKPIFIAHYMDQFVKSSDTSLDVEHKSNIEKAANIAFQAMCEYQFDQLLKAFDLLTEAIKLNKDDVESRILRIIIISKLGNTKLYLEAVADLNELLLETPKKAILYFLKVNIHKRLNQFSEAIKNFLMATKYDIGKDDVRFLIYSQIDLIDLLRFGIDYPKFEDESKVDKTKTEKQYDAKLADVVKKLNTKKTGAERIADLQAGLFLAKQAVLIDIFKSKAYLLRGTAHHLLNDNVAAINNFQIAKWVALHWNVKKDTNFNVYYESIISVLLDMSNVQEAIEQYHIWLAHKQKDSLHAENEERIIKSKFIDLVTHKATSCLDEMTEKSIRLATQCFLNVLSIDNSKVAYEKVAKIILQKADGYLKKGGLKNFNHAKALLREGIAIEYSKFNFIQKDVFKRLCDMDKINFEFSYKLSGLLVLSEDYEPAIKVLVEAREFLSSLLDNKNLIAELKKPQEVALAKDKLASLTEVRVKLNNEINKIIDLVPPSYSLLLGYTYQESKQPTEESIDSLIDKSIAFFIEAKEQEALDCFLKLHKRDVNVCVKITNKLLDEIKKYPIRDHIDNTKKVISLLRIAVTLDDTRLESTAELSPFKNSNQQPEQFNYLVYIHLADAYRANKERELALAVLQKATKRWRHFLGFQRGVSSSKCDKLKKEISAFEGKIIELQNEEKQTRKIQKDSTPKPQPVSRKYQFEDEDKDENSEFNPLSQAYKDKKIAEEKQKRESKKAKEKEKEKEKREKKLAVAKLLKDEAEQIKALEQQAEKFRWQKMREEAKIAVIRRAENEFELAILKKAQEDSERIKVEKKIEEIKNQEVKVSETVQKSVVQENLEIKFDAKESGQDKESKEMLRSPFLDANNYVPCLTGLKHLDVVTHILRILCGENKKNSAFVTGGASLRMLLHKINEMQCHLLGQDAPPVYFDFKKDIDIVTDLPGQIIMERFAAWGVRKAKMQAGLFLIDIKIKEDVTLRVEIKESMYPTLWDDMCGRDYRLASLMLDAEGNLFDLNYSRYKNNFLGPDGMACDPFLYLFSLRCHNQPANLGLMPDCALKDLVFYRRLKTVIRPVEVFSKDLMRVLRGEKMIHEYGLRAEDFIRKNMDQYAAMIPEMKETEKLHVWLLKHFRGGFVTPEEARKNIYFFVARDILKKIFHPSIFPKQLTDIGWVYDELAKCPPTLQAIYMIIYVYCISTSVTKEFMFKHNLHMADAFSKCTDAQFDKLYKSYQDSFFRYMQSAEKMELKALNKSPLLSTASFWSHSVPVMQNIAPTADDVVPAVTEQTVALRQS